MLLGALLCVAVVFAATPTNWTFPFSAANVPAMAIEKSTGTVLITAGSSLIGLSLSSGLVVLNVSGEFWWSESVLFASTNGLAVLVSTSLNGSQLLALAVNLRSGETGPILKSAMNMKHDHFRQSLAFSAINNRLSILDVSGILQTWQLLANGSFCLLFKISVPILDHQLQVDPNGDLFYLSSSFLSYDAIKLSGTNGAILWKTRFVGFLCGYLTSTPTSFYVSCGDDSINIFDSATGSHSTARSGGGFLTFLWDYATSNDTAVMSYSQYCDRSTNCKRQSTGYGVLALRGPSVIWNTPAGISDQSILTICNSKVLVWQSGLVLDLNTGTTLGQVPSWISTKYLEETDSALGMVVALVQASSATWILYGTSV